MSIAYEVVEDILVRLPLKSLIRFKSINKFLCSLIQNPNFASKQLHRRRKTSRCSFDHALILLPGGKYKGTSRRNNIFFLESIDHELDNWNDVSNESCPFMLTDRSPRIVGHCDGLVCFSFRAKGKKLGFSLWNPFLRHHKYIPVSEFPRTRLKNNYIAFGHDSRSRDYKIVRLGFFYERFSVPESFSSRAEVYSTRTDSWRPIPQIPPNLEFALDRCPQWRVGVFSGGFFYWVVVGKILTFDTSNEVFRLFGVPQLLFQKISHFRPSGYFVAKPMLWNETLCVVVFPRHNVGEKLVHVWVIGRIDHSNSDPNYTIPVEKFFTIRLDGLCNENSLYPKLLWNDQVISDLFRKCGVAWNVKTKKIKYISLGTNLEEDRKLFKNSSFQISGYIKSLVSLD